MNPKQNRLANFVEALGKRTTDIKKWSEASERAWILRNTIITSRQFEKIKQWYIKNRES